MSADSFLCHHFFFSSPQEWGVYFWPIIHDCLEDRARKEDELIIAFFEKDSDNYRDFTVLKKIASPSAFNSVGAEMFFFVCFQALVSRVIPICAVSPGL